MSDKPVLVLGATGSFGGAVAHELLARGVPVRALSRDPVAGRAQLGAAPGLAWVAADVQDGAALARAARGAGAIVHGVNYPYHRWRPHMTTATANVIAAARAEGALIVFPGNVYGLGRAAGRALDESAPMQPCSRKGALRVELETELRRAAGAGLRVLILRAGDYFGPTARNGLVDRIFQPALQGKPIQAIGRLDVAHQWAYLPDLARATVGLMAMRDRLDAFEVVHYAGIVAEPARRFHDAVAKAAGHPGLAVRSLPWWLFRLLATVDPVVRELMEMRYLWDEAVILDGAKLRRLLPGHVDAGLDAAVAATLASYRPVKP